MRILVGKVFGIGNAIMAVPMIKALQYKPDTVVDILIGNTPDDVGAYQVLSKVVQPQGKIYVSSALECDYDVAIMAIPFDGRWQNGTHFKAKKVLDGRTRPDPTTTGLVSWEKHEIEYQMENARALGFLGLTPSTQFMPPEKVDDKKIYLGVGYKKDAAGFWQVKHWGNVRFASFVERFLEQNRDMRIVTTGDAADLKLSIAPISRLVEDRRFEFKMSANLDEAFKTVASCTAYVGNDTGMMHVAASCGIPTVGLFFMGPKAVIKSAPWYNENLGLCKAIENVDKEAVTAEIVLAALEELMYEKELPKHE